MESNKGYFFCYNKTVSDFLDKKGINFITVAKDPKTGKMFSLYEKSSALQRALDEYKASKSVVTK